MEFYISSHLISFVILFTLFNLLEIRNRPKKFSLKDHDSYFEGENKSLVQTEKITLLIMTVSYPLSGITVIAYMLLKGDISTGLYTIGILMLIISCGLRFYTIQFVMQKNYTYLMRPAENATLVTSGPFKYVRHPLYLFYIFEVLALFFIYPNFISCACFLVNTAAVFYRTEQEDIILIQHFKDEYLSYMQHTKKLLPFIY